MGQLKGQINLSGHMSALYWIPLPPLFLKDMSFWIHHCGVVLGWKNEIRSTLVTWSHDSEDFLPPPLLSWLYGFCPLGLPTTSDLWHYHLPSSYLVRTWQRRLVWKRIRPLIWAKHQIRALCIILCITLASALVSVSFYLLLGQSADMVSAPCVFGCFLL